MKKRHLYITPGERKGLTILILLVFLSHSCILIYEHLFGYSQKERYEILDQILKEDSINLIRQRDDNTAAEMPFEILKGFNPNQIDTAFLHHYGLSFFAIRNIEKYRASGGVFKYKEDLLKIYGLDTSVYQRIYPLIDLPSLPTSSSEITFTQKGKKRLPRDHPKAKPDFTQNLFDPNNSSQTALEAYGFTKFAARNLLKYIKQGGRIEQSTDLLKVYGVDSLLVQRIAPLVVIVQDEEKLPLDAITLATDSKPLTEGSITPSLNINDATPEELRAIRGIGPYLSDAIVSYRKKLGGYYQLEQLLEVYALRPETFEQIKDHLIVDGSVQKIYVPDLQFKELLRHPYFDYELTKLLKNIPLTEYDNQISSLIAAGKIEDRLLPYLHVRDPHAKAVK